MSLQGICIHAYSSLLNRAYADMSLCQFASVKTRVILIPFEHVNLLSFMPSICFYFNTSICFTNELDNICCISTSALHFQNLLWRYKTTLTISGITEEYFYIPCHTRPNHTDIPYLKPAYRVTYPWTGIFWHIDFLE